MLVPLAIILAAGGLLAYAARDALMPPLEVRVVPVIARSFGSASDGTSSGSTGEAPRERQAGPSVQAPGWIEPDPYAVNVPALVDGIVRDVLVLEGDAVEEGQVVAHLIDDELRLAERSAQAVVAERRADVARAGADIEPMRAAILMAQSDADMLRDEIGRKRDLVASGGIPAGDFARLEIRLRGAEARVEQARGELASMEAASAQAQAALETARSLHAEAQLRLIRTEVRSPAAGVVMARLAAPGSRIAMTSQAAESADMTTTLLRLYDPSRLQVRTDVPLADAARIGLGTPAEITTEALPDETFRGTVTRVMHEANIQRNTVQFKVAVEAPSPQLKPEMLVRVRFHPGAAGQAGTAGGTAEATGLELLLPARVLVEREAGAARVWLVEAGPSAGVSLAVLRGVTLGAERDGDVVILSGVRPGDRVIVEPPATLRAGSRVRVVEEHAALNMPPGSH